MFRLSAGSLCALCTVAGFSVFSLVDGGRLGAQLLGSVQELFGLDPGEKERRVQLEATRKVVLAQSRARRATAQALAAGRTSLLAAGSRIREIDLARPSFRWQDFRAYFPGNSDEERFCRKAMDFAEAELLRQPERAQALRQRLERELRQALRRGLLRSPEAGN
jgi:hypothetical protein